ncbi:MAG: helix-turn-helix domain-containing protein [Bacteroidales bacterium]|nr:helix-turn-helix domain-containing protein [Bacteroidales bacterium]
MIQQPELGKKIADLRKERGLTQEELVEKCNLSVRTLQRIESGEVTPRTYTVKLIFEALEVSFDKSLIDDEGWINKRLEQFYISFIDLFNLKTNTMKKVIILTLIFTATFLILYIKFAESKPQKTINDITFNEQNELSMSWFNNGQVDSLISLFSNNACIYRYNLHPICGRDKIGELIRSVINQNSYKIIEMRTLSLKIIDSIAIEKSIVTIQFSYGEISKSIMLQEWHLNNGKWLIQNDISVQIK